nr:MAG TPA: hypothetical protein [Caudoviricetes sp.]
MNFWVEKLKFSASKFCKVLGFFLLSNVRKTGVISYIIYRACNFFFFFPKKPFPPSGGTCPPSVARSA